jgi:hypothetical protein
MPTFAERFRMPSAADPYNFGILDRSRYFFLSSSSSVVLTRLSGTPFQTHYFSENVDRLNITNRMVTSLTWFYFLFNIFSGNGKRGKNLLPLYRIFCFPRRFSSSRCHCAVKAAHTPWWWNINTDVWNLCLCLQRLQFPMPVFVLHIIDSCLFIIQM